MFAMFTIRKLALTSRINQIQYQLMMLAQRLTDLGMYGANIQDGYVSPDEMLNSSGSLFAANMQYNQRSFMRAAPFAEMAFRNYAVNQQQMMAQGLITQDQLPDFFMARRAIYMQVLQEQAKGETKRIAVEENRISQEKLRLETQLKAAMAELESVEKAEDQGIKQSAPKYA